MKSTGRDGRGLYRLRRVPVEFEFCENSGRLTCDGEENPEWACKPGSVESGHFSATTVARRL